MSSMDIPTVTHEIYEAYREHVKTCMENAVVVNCVETSLSSSASPELNNFVKAKVTSLKAFLVWKAIHRFCPPISKAILPLIGLFPEDATDEYISCGLLRTASNGTGDTTFICHTVAEFLVAEYTAKVLLGKNPFDTEGIFRQRPHQLLDVLLSTSEGREFCIHKNDFEEGKQHAGIEFSISEFHFEASLMTRLFNGGIERISAECLPEIHGDLLSDFFSNRKASQIVIASIVSGCPSILRLLRVLWKNDISQSPRHQIRDSLLCQMRSVSGKDLPDQVFLSCCAYLCLAAKYGNVAMVQELQCLFQEGVDVDLAQICAEMPLSMKTPLHFAVERHNHDLVEYLARVISLPSRNVLLHCVNSTSKYDARQVRNVMNICNLLLQNCSNLLHEECYNESTHPEVFTFLAEQGALPRRRIKDVLYCKFPYVSPTTVKRLINAPGFQNVRDALLFKVIKQHLGTLETIKELLAHGASPYFSNGHNYNALHVASSQGNLDLARYLLSLEMPLECPDAFGFTPLLLAHRHVDMVKYLISENANVLAADSYACNLAHRAAIEENDGLFEYLLTLRQAKALFKGLSTYHRTPLHVRLLRSQKGLKGDTVGKILSLDGYKVNEVDCGGSNYFILATQRRMSVAVLKVLEAHGVNPKAENSSGQTALHYAAYNGDRETCQYLVELGVPVDRPNKGGQTPLLLSKGVELFQYLVSKGANIRVADVNGKTAAHYAVSYRDTEKILYLMELEEATYLFWSADAAGINPIQKMTMVGPHMSREAWERVMERGQHFLKNLSPAQCGWLRGYLLTKYIPVNRIPNWPGYEKNSKAEKEAMGVAVYLSARGGDLERLQHLNFSDVSLEFPGNEGSPLMASFPEGKAAKFLIEKGANIYCVNGEGDTIAHKMRGDVNGWAEYLIKGKGAEELFKMKNNKGRTPLHEWLIATDLYLKPETVKLILKVPGIPINVKDAKGDNMFHSAVKAGRSVELLKILHEFGVSPHKLTKKGQNLVHMMSIEGSVRVVDYLVSIGIPQDVPDEQGNTPFLLAFRNPNVLHYLATQGANIRARDSDGNNIAHKVAYFGVPSKEGIDSLLESPVGLDLFAQANFRGRTPLHLAMMSQESEMDTEKIKRLLSLPGVNVNARDKMGNSMFLSAVRTRKSMEVIKTLLDSGANPHAVNKEGQNALHVAVDSRNPCRDTVILCQFLVSLGCKADHRDSCGRTVCDVITSRSVNLEVPNYPKIMEEGQELVRLLKFSLRQQNNIRVGGYARL